MRTSRQIFRYCRRWSRPGERDARRGQDPAPPRRATFDATERLRGRFVGRAPNEGRTIVRCTVPGHASPIVIDVREGWAPHGAARFEHLASVGAFDGATIASASESLVVFRTTATQRPQDLGEAKHRAVDDANPNRVPIARGVVFFAAATPGGSDGHALQVHIATSHLPWRGRTAWEAAIGMVISGMDILDAALGSSAPEGLLRTAPDRTPPQALAVERCVVEARRPDGFDPIGPRSPAEKRDTARLLQPPPMGPGGSVGTGAALPGGVSLPRRPLDALSEADPPTAPLVPLPWVVPTTLALLLVIARCLGWCRQHGGSLPLKTS